MISCTFSKKLHAANGMMTLAVDISIPKESIIAFYGPSGSGKTSTLRVLAGLLEPEEGFIKSNDTVWLNTGKNINLIPQKRNVSFAFQDYALFPNMSVLENLQFALPKQKDQAIIQEVLAVMDLEQLKNHKPKTLSGGQQQRVSLARALVRATDVLLLDEPLSALDITTRKKLQQYIVETHKKLKLTTILISHDIEEVFYMANQVFCFNQGIITDSGIPIEVFKSNQRENYIEGKIIAIHAGASKAHVLIGNQIVTVALTKEQLQEYKIGDRFSIQL